MDRYLAETLYMDTTFVAKNLGTWPTLPDAERACERHTSAPLEFRARTPSIFKAQGEHYWYRITELSAQGTED